MGVNIANEWSGFKYVKDLYIYHDTSDSHYFALENLRMSVGDYKVNRGETIQHLPSLSFLQPTSEEGTKKTRSSFCSYLQLKRGEWTKEVWQCAKKYP
jgi:hypothetical protein